jgi:phosphate transport system substrate-binding protein
MKQFALLLVVGLTLFGCSRPEDSNDGINRYVTTIYADESFRPFMETSGMTYEGRYPEKTIAFEFVSEQKALRALIDDKTKTAVVSRDFTKEEKVQLKKGKIVVNTTLLAKDAVVLIINNENQDSTLTVDELKSILRGTTKRNLVIDQSQSANFLYLSNLIDNQPFGKNVFVHQSNRSVINYVEKNKNTIGVIGYNWIGDLEDPVVQQFRKQFKIMRIARDSKQKYFEPYFRTIDRDEYPLTRFLYAINKGASDGLNASYINFIASDIGQRLVEKAGLIPARKTERQINIISE